MASLPYSVVASYLPLPCLGGDLRPVIAVQLEEWSSGMFPCGCLAGGCVSRWVPPQVMPSRNVLRIWCSTSSCQSRTRAESAALLHGQLWMGSMRTRRTPFAGFVNVSATLILPFHPDQSYLALLTVLLLPLFLERRCVHGSMLSRELICPCVGSVGRFSKL